MSVKTVTLSADAYEALAALKREGESFSEVVRRLTKKNHSLLEFAGAWKRVPAATMKEIEDFLRTGDELSAAKLQREFRRPRR
jgi:predicted CopG family antitoxin